MGSHFERTWSSELIPRYSVEWILENHGIQRTFYTSRDSSTHPRWLQQLDGHICWILILITERRCSPVSYLSWHAVNTPTSNNMLGLAVI